MGEIKSVKVDNWGVFFLQKLQNFFNKTDYCDLTLQFNDNSQLKVHRLVLSACTDYFNVLEQTCEMIDDVLIMPLELQADVVVPIVNFMYTGTLEFELRMYGRLLKTARDMNMTVLLKLLEAHRRTMEKTPTVQTLNRNNQRTSNYQRRTQTTTTRRGGHSNTTSYKSIQIKPIQSYFQASTTTQNITKYTTSTKPVKGPSRFDYPPEGKVLPPETFEQSFDTISYESKPLICKEEPDSEDYDGMVQKSSTFEELRRGYNNNKRPASSVSSFESPPEKKPNINDVKEYAEQQRVRKQIAQEFDDDNEFEETLDDEFHHDDDDDEYVPPSSFQKQSKQQQNKKPASNKEQLQQSVVIKQQNNRQTIFVKDTQNSNVNHAKIISEVLRKYPNLVKNNKNIKLKILPKSSGTGKSETQKIVLKTEVEQRPMAVPQLPPPSAKHNTYSSATNTQRITGNIAAGKSLLQTKLPPKSSVTIKKVDVPTSATPSSSQQPRRIDSKTMHSLIAMGAENRTGPWLCLRCGVNGRPISIPSYRGFRRHLINAHQEKIDPRLCEHCGWRSTNNRELFHHMLVEHKIKPPTTYSFPKCDLCDTILLNYSDLERHVAENHEEGVEVNQSCIYCNKTFANESLLYAHMKSKHRNRAKQDGVVDFSEDDEIAFESDSQLSQYHSDAGSDNKIKILSDISLPKNIPIIQAEDNAPGTTITLPTNIIQADSNLIDPLEGPKFVNADGKEMELTDEQRQEIISQLQNQDHGAVVMVLNDDAEQLTSVLSGGDVSTSSPSTSVQATNVAIATPVAEKEQHKPRKTKHTVKTEIDDVGEGEEMIEWLDEESGNIMKVPLSKFSKMGDMEEEDEEGEEEMETEEETEEANKEVEAFENADDEEKSTKSKDIKSSDKIKKEINDDDDHNHKLESADENTSDSVKDKKEDKKCKDSTSGHEIEEKDESTKSQQKSKTKSKTAENSAMETLKILTGDWSDDDDGEEEEEEEEEDESIDKDNLKDVNNEISKDEEILFETLEERKTNGESSNKLSKEDDNKNKSKDNEKQNIDVKRERKVSDMDLDNMSTDEQEDILKMNDVKVEDVTDDDMKIIEELKNYEQEQLEAAEAEAEAKADAQAETEVEAEVETTATAETKDKSDIIAGEKELRSKPKSISKSASPTMSESSNSGSSNISATNTSGSDKPKRRGRPKKSPIIKEQKLDSQDKNDDGDDKVKEDDKKIETAENKAEESKDDKRNKDKQIENDEDKDDENSKVSRKLSADEENSSVKSDDHEKNKKSDDKDETDTDANTTETTSQEPKNASDSVNKDNNDDLITKAEIRNLISDWGDDDDDDDDDDL